MVNNAILLNDPFSVQHERERGEMKTAYLLYFGVSDSEDAECVARHYFGSLKRHHNITIFLTVLRRPVLVAFSLRDADEKGTTFKVALRNERSFDDSENGHDSLCLSPPG